MKRYAIPFFVALLFTLSSSANAELRCHTEVDKCAMKCDSNGKNCRNDCSTKQVCVEVSPPPQTVQPAGGVSKDGVWGGVTVPINPK